MRSTTRKSLLYEYDMWMMMINIGSKCSEFRRVSNTKGIPGDGMKTNAASDV